MKSSVPKTLSRAAKWACEAVAESAARTKPSDSSKSVFKQKPYSYTVGELPPKVKIGK